jgi:hypothetical protein
MSPLTGAAGVEVPAPLFAADVHYRTVITRTPRLGTVPQWVPGNVINK